MKHTQKKELNWRVWRISLCLVGLLTVIKQNECGFIWCRFSPPREITKTNESAMVRVHCVRACARVGVNSRARVCVCVCMWARLCFRLTFVVLIIIWSSLSFSSASFIQSSTPFAPSNWLRFLVIPQKFSINKNSEGYEKQFQNTKNNDNTINFIVVCPLLLHSENIINVAFRLYHRVIYDWKHFSTTPTFSTADRSFVLRKSRAVLFFLCRRLALFCCVFNFHLIQLIPF